jgi:hypothetical protein
MLDVWEMSMKHCNDNDRENKGTKKSVLED